MLQRLRLVEVEAIKALLRSCVITRVNTGETQFSQLELTSRFRYKSKSAMLVRLVAMGRGAGAGDKLIFSGGGGSAFTTASKSPLYQDKSPKAFGQLF